MTEAIREQECLNTLKTFNNTIVTIRLYPANAPQITHAIERGYKAVKTYLRQHGNFTIGLCGNEPELCGEILDTQVVQSISNLIVFRHLGLLGVDKLLITPGIDRVQFKKILDIFIAKVDEIKREGGGQAFVTRLGVEKFFPENVESDPVGADELDGVAVEDEIAGDVDVRKEFVDVLLGRERRAQMISELRVMFAAPVNGAPILVAAISGVLDGMLQKKLYITSSALEQICENANNILPAGQEEDLVTEAATLLLQKLDLQAIVILISQSLQSKVGVLLVHSLGQQIAIDKFGSVIRELRQIVKQLRITQTKESKELHFISEAQERLLATPKGKQFLGQEKAKSIIEAGEKTRRARRVETGVKALLKGNDEVLKNDEFNVHLPFVVQKMEAEGMDREVRALLRTLSSHFSNGDADSRERFLRILAQIAENLALANRWNCLSILSGPLLSWLKKSENGDFLYEKVAVSLHALMPQLWNSDAPQLGDEILSVFYQIRSGAIRRSAAVRSIIGRAQDKGLDRKMMSNLLQQCLDSPGDEDLSRRLILQGPVVSSFLIDSLIRTEESKDRVKIIDLLTYGEQFLPPILIEKLKEPMPWYGKRNLLKLLSDTGSVENLDVVYPFLQHDDLRVQREAFICLYKISGKKRKDALLRALNESGETMKLQVIRALVPFGDADVAQGLGQLLVEYPFYSEDFRDTLLSNVCLAVARCPYPNSEKILLNFLDQRGQRGSRKIGSKVWQTAEDALKQVLENQQGERQLKAKAGQLRKSALSKVGGSQKAGAEKKLITGLAEEKAIRDLVDNDEKDKARLQLVELISKISRLRRFSQAEQLRDWLIEIDSLALTDIIRAAEIIEEEKHAAVDKGHMEIWSGLFDVLTTEEFSAFYHALQHKRYNNEEIIMKKGATQTSLFFINSGNVKLFYRAKDQDILVKNLQSGQVLGVGSFFDASVWTLSAAALGQVDVSILQFKKMQQWHNDYPALESKLQDFCLKFESVDDFFHNSEKDRRRHKRYQVAPLRLSLTLLDEEGRSTGVNSKGELSDISRGGGSFSMRISKKENARLLLGRNLKISLPVEETAGKPMSFVGVIVAIRTLHSVEYEYSVHVEFNSALDSSEMQQILRSHVA